MTTELSKLLSDPVSTNTACPELHRAAIYDRAAIQKSLLSKAKSQRQSGARSTNPGP